MSEIAIQAKNLSKLYHIGNREPYKSLRDVLTNAIFTPLRWFRTLNPELKTSTSNCFWALKDVSFEIKTGEVVSVIGRNGAGKSTLLKILSRITEPTEGYAKIYGRVGSLLEVGTGFHPELTGRENIYLNGAIIGMKKAEINRKFDEIVAFAEVEKFVDTPVKHYSSGMYIRLAFAVAAHLDLEILLVDEVLAVGDAAFQKKCLGKMGEVAKGGRTVLFVSHNMTAVSALCNKGILLEEGQIAFIGSALSSIEKYLSEMSSSTKNIPISQREREKRLPLHSKIIEIDILTENDKNEEVLLSNKPFTVRLKILSSFNMRCGVYIAIRDYHQVLIWLDSGHLQNKLYQFKKGITQIDCKVSPVYLSSGDYKIDCGLTIPNQEWIDFVPDAYFFSIHNFDPYGTGFDLSQKFARYHVHHKWEEPIELNND